MMLIAIYRRCKLNGSRIDPSINFRCLRIRIYIPERVLVNPPIARGYGGSQESRECGGFTL